MVKFSYLLLVAIPPCPFFFPREKTEKKKLDKFVMFNFVSRDLFQWYMIIWGNPLKLFNTLRGDEIA